MSNVFQGIYDGVVDAFSNKSILNHNIQDKVEEYGTKGADAGVVEDVSYN